MHLIIDGHKYKIAMYNVIHYLNTVYYTKYFTVKKFELFLD